MFSSYIQFDCEGYALSDTFYRIEIELLVFKLCPVLVVIFQVELWLLIWLEKWITLNVRFAAEFCF